MRFLARFWFLDLAIFHAPPHRGALGNYTLRARRIQQGWTLVSSGPFRIRARSRIFGAETGHVFLEIGGRRAKHPGYTEILLHFYRVFVDALGRADTLAVQKLVGPLGDWDVGPDGTSGWMAMLDIGRTDASVSLGNTGVCEKNVPPKKF